MRKRGLYVLAMRLKSGRTIRVGKLGVFDFPAGIYLYVGSAWGYGGLAARLRRHLALAGTDVENPHWHLDYLLPFIEIVGVVTFPGKRSECALVEKLAQNPDVERFPLGFGAADCRCKGHLLFLQGEKGPEPPESQGGAI